MGRESWRNAGRVWREGKIIRGAGPLCGLPLNSEGELPGSRDGLDDDVGLLDAAAEELLHGTLDEGLDDGRVPAGVDDADAQGAAVVLLRGRSLDAGHF